MDSIIHGNRFDDDRNSSSTPYALIPKFTAAVFGILLIGLAL